MRIFPVPVRAPVKSVTGKCTRSRCMLSGLAVGFQLLHIARSPETHYGTRAQSAQKKTQTGGRVPNHAHSCLRRAPIRQCSTPSFESCAFGFVKSQTVGARGSVLKPCDWSEFKTAFKEPWDSICRGLNRTQPMFWRAWSSSGALWLVSFSLLKSPFVFVLTTFKSHVMPPRPLNVHSQSQMTFLFLLNCTVWSQATNPWCTCPGWKLSRGRVSFR